MKVQADISEDWIRWQKEEHVPEIMRTNLFYDFKIYRLLDVDDSDGPTYITQFFSETKDNYDRYVNEFAPALRKKANEKWGDRFIGFRTFLEGVQ
jgi:hypothetical protein